MTYQAPVDDILHALKTAAGLDDLVGRGLLDGVDEDTIRAVLGGSRQVRVRGARSPERAGRPRRLQAGRRQGGDAARLEGGLPAVRRRRLGCAGSAGGVGRAEPAASGRHGRRRGVERIEPGVRPVPAAHLRRHRCGRGPGQRGAEASLPAQDGVGRMDRHHEPDRAARGLRSLRAQDAGREAGRRQLFAHRHQDLHHLRRPRDDRQHRASRARPAARCAARHARHLAVPGAQVSRRQGRLAGRAQRRDLRRRRAQARHPRQPHLRDEVRRGRRGRRRLPRRRGEPRPQRHVHHDERGAAGGRHAGRGGGGAGDAARLRLRQGAPPGPRRHRQGRRRRHGAHHRARRHPPLAADHEGAHAGRARHLPGDGQGDRRRAPGEEPGRAGGGRETAWRCSHPSPRPSPPTSAARSPPSACRCTAAWASSRRPARRRSIATRASCRSTRAPTASRPSTSSRASFPSRAARSSRATSWN